MLPLLSIIDHLQNDISQLEECSDIANKVNMHETIMITWCGDWSRGLLNHQILTCKRILDWDSPKVQLFFENVLLKECFTFLGGD